MHLSICKRPQGDWFPQRCPKGRLALWGEMALALRRLNAVWYNTISNVSGLLSGWKGMVASMDITQMVWAEKSEVLVIGGGLAGMYAAIEAHRAGRKVRILSKGKVGGSGSSLVSMSVHRFAPKEPGLQEDYRRRFLASGEGEQDLRVAEMLIQQGADTVEALREFGLPLEYRGIETPSGTYHYLACCKPKRGRLLTRELRDYLLANTDAVLDEDVMAFDLVKASGSILGVLAERDGRVVYYPADAVVLAAGGAGNIYRYTSNTTDLTGDGYAMALRAGLRLVGMEFVQFYPYRICTPRRADIFPDVFSHGAVFRNEKGERFMESYPMKELENRDVLARALYRQKRVYLDLTACDWAYLERECPNIADMARKFLDQPLEVRPMAHFFMGGIPLEPDCSTAIKGLFACGEVTGGLHGANRLSGSALTEAALFGRIAGREAAAGGPCLRDAGAERAELEKLLALVGGVDRTGELPERQTLRENMWAAASVERNMEDLRRLHAFLEEMEAQLDRAAPQPLRQWLELRNMTAVSKAVTEAALQRPESLGAHYIVQ